MYERQPSNFCLNPQTPSKVVVSTDGTSRITDRQTDRQTGRQAGRQTNRQTDVQTDRQTEF